MGWKGAKRVNLIETKCIHVKKKNNLFNFRKIESVMQHTNNPLHLNPCDTFYKNWFNLWTSLKSHPLIVSWLRVRQIARKYYT